MRCADNSFSAAPATIPLENLSAAMALVSLNSPLRVIRVVVGTSGIGAKRTSGRASRNMPSHVRFKKDKN